MSLRQKSQLAAGVIISGFILAVAWHYILGTYMQYPAPYNSFLFRGQELFTDFFWHYVGAFDPYTPLTENLIYFPVFYGLLNLLRTLPFIPALLIYLIGFVIIFVRSSVVFFQPAGLIMGIGAACLSLPFLTILDRGNLEGAVFLAVLGFVTFYRSRPWLALCLLVFAITAKLFPAIFLLLYISDKRYREVSIAMTLSLGITLLAYQQLPGGLMVNITNHLRGLDWYHDTYAVNNGGLGFGHSLYGAAKYLLLANDPFANYRAFAAAAYLPNLALSLAGGILTAAYVVWVEGTYWKKLAILVCAMNLLPFVSADYKLIYGFLPLFYWLREDQTEQSDGLYGVLLALLLIPKDFVRLHEWPDVSLGVLLNPLLMLLLALVIVVKGIRTVRRKGNKLHFWKLAAVGLSIGFGTLVLTAWQQGKNVNTAERSAEQLTLARAAENQTDWPIAIRSYKKASALQPYAKEPRLLLVALLEKQYANFTDSYLELRTILKLDGISLAERDALEEKVHRDLFLRGEHELLRHELLVAANTFATLKAQFPQAGEAIKGECEVLLAQGDYLAGLEALEDWNRAEPEAETYLRYQDWSKIRFAALEVLNSVPEKQQYAWQLAGWSSLKLGDWEAARNQFEQSLSNGPTRWSFEGLLQVYLHKGEVEAMQRTIREWLVFAPASLAAQRYAQNAGLVP